MGGMWSGEEAEQEFRLRLHFSRRFRCWTAMIVRVCFINLANSKCWRQTKNYGIYSASKSWNRGVKSFENIGWKRSRC